MMVVDVEQATRIINALASINYQTQHDRQGIQKKGLLELNTSDALLAQNKIMTQQIETFVRINGLKNKGGGVNCLSKIFAKID